MAFSAALVLGEVVVELALGEAVVEVLLGDVVVEVLLGVIVLEVLGGVGLGDVGLGKVLGSGVMPGVWTGSVLLAPWRMWTTRPYTSVPFGATSCPFTVKSSSSEPRHRSPGLFTSEFTLSIIRTTTRVPAGIVNRPAGCVVLDDSLTGVWS